MNISSKFPMDDTLLIQRLHFENYHFKPTSVSPLPGLRIVIIMLIVPQYTVHGPSASESYVHS